MTLIVLLPISSMADTQFFSSSEEESISKCGTLTAFNACNYIAGGWVMTHVSPQLSDANWRISDNKSQGFNIIAGRHFKPHWFGEISYNDLGATELTNRSSSTIESEGITHKAGSLHIGYLLREPSEQFNVYVKGGISALQKKVGINGVLFDKETKIKPTLGLGAQWQASDTGLFARLGVDIYERESMSAGLMFGYKFGETKKVVPVPRKIKPAPVVVAVKPTPIIIPKPAVIVKPKPKVVKVVKKPVIKKVVKQPAFAGVLKGVNFHTNSAVLTQKAEAILNNVAKQLKRWNGLKVLLIGHTDDVGSNASNFVLSKNRASSVKAYLIEQGVKSKRMVTAGKGESQPRTSNKTKAGKAVNRRVELRAL